MDTPTVSGAAGVACRGAHLPAAGPVRLALAHVGGAGTIAAFPAVIDATPLAGRSSETALDLMRASAVGLSAAPPPGGRVGAAVFLLGAVDGPEATAAIRRLARAAAPGWRMNAVRIGRSPDDAARCAAFALACPSLTGQLIALDRPLQSSVEASVPAQPDPPSVPDPKPRPAEGGVREVMIRDLVLPCRVGVRRHERDAPQRVRVNLKLVVDETPLHDRLEDVVCYDEIVDHIRRIAIGGHINLVETLAERIADGCFGDRRVRSARIAVEKLDVYPDATAAGVRIVRHRAESP